MLAIGRATTPHAALPADVPDLPVDAPFHQSAQPEGQEALEPVRQSSGPQPGQPPQQPPQPGVSEELGPVRQLRPVRHHPQPVRHHPQPVRHRRIPRPAVSGRASEPRVHAKVDVPHQQVQPVRQDAGTCCDLCHRRHLSRKRH
jgi:hypothetical protein